MTEGTDPFATPADATAAAEMALAPDDAAALLRKSPLSGDCGTDVPGRQSDEDGTDAG